MSKDVDIFVEEQLPEPLTVDELVFLFKKVREGDMASRDKIALHNIRLVINVVFTKFRKYNYDYKELVSVGVIGLLKAIDTFKLEKNTTFSAYASKCIENEIWMFIRKIKKNEDSLDEPIIGDKDGNTVQRRDIIVPDYWDVAKDYEKKEIRKIVGDLVEMLDGREREIVKLYFGFYDDRQYSQNEIAIMMDMTRSNVSRIMKESLMLLGKKLKKYDVITGDFNIRSWVYNTQNKNGNDLNDVLMLNTIYGYFHNYSHQQVDIVLSMLPEDDMELLILRYGSDFDNPVSDKKMYRVYEDKFYGEVIPKMRKMLNSLECINIYNKKSIVNKR